MQFFHCDVRSNIFTVIIRKSIAENTAIPVIANTHSGILVL